MILQQNDDDFLFENNFILLNKEALPFLIYQDLKKNKTHKEIIKGINEWFSTRIVPNYRDNKDSIFEEYQVRDGYELANKHYALSLSDQYWLKPLDENISWKDINYFDHDYDGKDFFEATYGKDSFNTLNIESTSKNKYTTPNNTLGGQLKKAWIKVNNENYLLKGSGTLYAFEPINEVIASKICEIINVPYVKYSLKKIQTKRQQTLVSVCKCMINSSQEIIPAYQVLQEENQLTHSKDDFYVYIKILEDHGIQNADEKVQKMQQLSRCLAYLSCCPFCVEYSIPLCAASCKAGRAVFAISSQFRRGICRVRSGRTAGQAGGAAVRTDLHGYLLS